jgi:hypothetical protein
MAGLAGYGEVVLSLVAFGVLCVLAAVLLIARAPPRPSGGTDRRRRAREQGKRFAKVVPLALLAVCALGYVLNLRSRMTECTWERSVSNDDGGLYTAEYCNIALDKVLLRIRRTSDGSLLAERTYRYLDAPKVTWTRDRVVFDTYENGNAGAVALPPTLLDRLRARLP